MNKLKKNVFFLVKVFHIIIIVEIFNYMYMFELYVKPYLLLIKSK